MVKLTPKRVWVTLGIVEAILLVLAIVSYASNPNDMWAGMQFIIPLGFAFLVMIGVLIYSMANIIIKLSSRAQSPPYKRSTFKRLFFVVLAVVAVSLIVHGADIVFDF